MKSSDGTEFLFDPGLISPQQVVDSVKCGDQCRVVYAPTLVEYKLARGLSVGDKVVLDENFSTRQWQRSRNTGYLSIAGTVAAAGIAALLIDRIWCKADREQIKRLKAEIEKREQRKEGRK